MSEVSRQFGVSRGVIHYWRRQEAIAVLGAPVRFTPVAVAQAGQASGTTEIELGSGVRLRVDAAVD